MAVNVTTLKEGFANIAKEVERIDTEQGTKGAMDYIATLPESIKNGMLYVYLISLVRNGMIR
jgi:hypothetical protein